MRKRLWILSAAALATACGDGANGDDSRGGSGSLVTSLTNASDSDSDTESNTEADSNSGNSNSGNSNGGTDSNGSDGTPKFDIGGVPDVNLSCGGGGGGGGGSGLGTDFSYLWVANSPEGTVSKINTQTLVEEGRYLVRDTPGSPSRTSVNLNGDMAVANRSGGVTMIRARLEDCPDPNNTSTGAGDVKAWQDGCIAWYTPFTYSTQRPVAWTQGDFDQGTCRYEDTKLWTAGAPSSGGIMEILLLDGETGLVEASVSTGMVANTYGIYGAAVDADGNFWGSMLSGQTLFKVQLSDMSIQSWSAPAGYGMTVDPKGRPWTCDGSLNRFDPVTQLWDSVSPGSQGGGCMVDADGVLWVAGTGNRLLGVDMDTMQTLHDFSIPGYAKGISIDFEGNVWAVSQGAEAWRVNPQTLAIDTFTGLTSPYTYSDMTGFALSQASPPEG